MTYFPRDLTIPSSAPVSEVDWEEVDCLLCGRRNWLPLVEAPDDQRDGPGLWFVVVQCQECGLCFTNPRPSLSSIRRFHTRWPVMSHRPGSCSRRRLLNWVRRYGASSRFMSQLPCWHGQGRLLDVGCGRGLLLQRLHAEGWQVVGLDPSPVVVHHIHSQLKLPAVIGSLPHPDLQPASFDVITIREMLAQVHDPLELLRQARKLLVPGGKLHVTVPNIDSLPFRWFGHNWQDLNLPRHLTHFAPWTLQRMLQRAGFRVQSLRMVPHPAGIRRSARRACATRNWRSWQRWLTLRAASFLAARYACFVQESDLIQAIAQR